MKKLISLLLMVVCLFSLTSCYKTDIKKPKVGKKVSELIFTTDDNEIITINESTDPFFVLDLIGTLSKYRCFEYSGKINYANQRRINKTYKGLFLTEGDSDPGSITYFSTKNDLLKAKRYYQLGQDIVSINVYDDKIINGSASLGDDYFSGIDNSDIINEKKLSKLNMYFSTANFVYKSLTFGSYLQSEYLADYDYDLKLVENYIIFSFKQSIGKLNGKDHGNKKGTFKNTLYFNVTTNQIDYFKVSLNVHDSESIFRNKTKYTIIGSSIDKNIIYQDITFLEQYIREQVAVNN